MYTNLDVTHRKHANLADCTKIEQESLSHVHLFIGCVIRLLNFKGVFREIVQVEFI